MIKTLEEGAALRPCNRKRVLLVDDEPTITRLFKELLAPLLPGCAVDTASNGMEALEAFRQRRHKVVLMDLHMPVMDGASAFRELSRWCTESNSEMPSVVFCTGFAPPEAIDTMVTESDRHALLFKPIGIQRLAATVKAHLKIPPLPKDATDGAEQISCPAPQVSSSVATFTQTLLTPQRA